MCILCDHETLEILTTPLERLGPGELAEAIRTARDAAGPGVLDYAEEVLRGDTPDELGAEIYGEIVVARALEAGVLSGADATGWGTRLEMVTGALDPRVQAFVSSCAEIIDEYRVMLVDRQQVLERFLESREGELRFGWLGRDGELWFDYRSESLAALAEAEALEIAQRELNEMLHSMDPEILLRYSTLPDTGLDVLIGIQAKPAETADSLLAGLVDLAALATDRIRSGGYSQFFPGEGEVVEDARFGEWIIVRLPSLP